MCVCMILCFILCIPFTNAPICFQEKATDTQYLQYCTVCQGYKAPRSHHCRKCERLNIRNRNIF